MVLVYFISGELIFALLCIIFLMRMNHISEQEHLKIKGLYEEIESKRRTNP